MVSRELDLLGPRVRLLTETGQSSEDFCLVSGIIPPGMAIPLHSHADREVFFIQDGEVDVYVADVWSVYRAGEAVNVAGNVKHALFNKGAVPATVITVTTNRLGRFFEEAGRPAEEVPPGPPSPEAIANFAQAAQAYGYWMASPEENAAIGVNLGPPPAL